MDACIEPISDVLQLSRLLAVEQGTLALLVTKMNPS